jgi:uncharacterized protein YqgV (UPF0045/DUF77 family)
MNKNFNIHLGLQVVPMAPREQSFPAIDQVIEMIASAGHRYEVTPFETFIECSFEEAIKIIEQSSKLMNEIFKGEYLINARFHIHTEESIVWEDKVKPHVS